MITYNILAGTVDVSVVIRIIDSADGTPETGVVFNTSGIDIQYRRELAASTAITEATLAALTTAHSDGGFLHIGNGYYRLDLPDAACASGVSGVLVHGVVTGMIVIGCYVNLTPVPVDLRTWLGSAPNALVSSRVDASTGAMAANVITATAINADAITDAKVASDVTIASVTGAVGSVTGSVGSVGTGGITTATFAAGAINAAAIAADAITDAKVASDVTIASVTGSVGSVTGAVGSVTGAVGSVTGAVGSVAAGGITAASIAADAIGASELAADALTEIRSLASGTSDSGTTVTMVDAARTEADTDYWKGQIIVFTSGNIAGQARLITGFNAATDTITFAPATTQAAATQTYEIWPGSRVDLGQIAGADISATTAQLGVNTVQAGAVAWGSGAITAASIAADAITAAKVADGTIDAATFAAGAINAAAIASDAITDAKVASDLTIASVTGSVGSVTGSVGSVTGAVGSVGTGGITTATFAAGAINAAAIATDAITAAKIAADAIGASELAADAVTEIQSGLATAAALTTVDDFLDTEVAAILAAVDTEVAAIKAVTDLLPNAGALTTIQSDLDNIQTRIPAALTGAGNMKSDGLAVDGDANAATNLRRATLTNVLITVGSASSTTSVVTSSMSPAAAVTDGFKNRALVFDRDTTTANLRGQSTVVTASTAGGVLTVSPDLTTAPVSGDTGVLV